MKTVAILTILILAFANVAGASGSRVGNGGHGVVCTDSSGQVSDPELLDLYEAVHTYGRLPDMIFVNSLDEAIHAYEQKIAMALPAGHPFLNVFDQVALLKSDIELHDGELPSTDDLGLSAFIGPNCRIVQLAIRGVFPLDGMLEVRRDFWTHSFIDVQALFLLHEAFHSWFTPGEVTGDEALRQLVGFIYTSSLISPEDQAVVRKLIETREPLFFERPKH